MRYGHNGWLIEIFNGKKDMNYLRIIRKLFFRKNSLPIYFILFVTNKCNAKCRHCFYWKNINQPNKELKFEELVKISQNIKSIEHLAITGGEPFIRKDLDVIVQAFYENSKIKSMSLQSNGLLSDEIFITVKNILDRCPRLNLQISISIDNIGSKHDEIRQVPGIFNKATETIKKLKDIQCKNLQVAVNTTLSAQNQDDIEMIYFYIRDTIKPDAFFPLLIRGNIKNKNLSRVDPNAYKRLIDLCRKDMVERKIFGYKNFLFSSWINARDFLSRKLMLNKILNKSDYFINCFAGNLTGVMYENGDVCACEVKNLKLGNIREADYQLKKIWFSQAAVQSRKWIKQNRCFCTHECFFNFNVLFNLRIIPKLFKEWLKLI